MNIRSHLLITPLTPISLFAFQNKVPLLSVEALHHLHIFIFVLAVVHVTFSVLTVVFGGARVSSMPSTQLFSLFSFITFLCSWYRSHSIYRFVSGNTGKIQLQNGTTNPTRVNYFFYFISSILSTLSSLCFQMLLLFLCILSLLINVICLLCFWYCLFTLCHLKSIKPLQRFF